MFMQEHGLRIFSGGFVLHSDGRRRSWSEYGVQEIPRRSGNPEQRRGGVKAFSQASRRRLELIAASAANQFRSHLILTYHAKAEAWEDDAARNARVVRRSKRDLNRFLSGMRRELGAYVWVQEFQTRGVVHYHVLCEGELPESKVALAWCRAIDSLDDVAALKYGAKVEAISGEKGARWYVSGYIGKARSKLLPVGVEAAGRWWSRSRSVKLTVLADVAVMVEGETVARWAESRVVRSLRRFLSGEMRFRYRGGLIVDWNGKLSTRAATLAPILAAFYTSQVTHSGLLGPTS